MKLCTIKQASAATGCSVTAIKLLSRLHAGVSVKGLVNLRRLRKCLLDLKSAARAFGYLPSTGILERKIREDKLEQANPGERPALVSVWEMERMLKSQTHPRGKKRG